MFRCRSPQKRCGQSAYAGNAGLAIANGSVGHPSDNATRAGGLGTGRPRSGGAGQEGHRRWPKHGSEIMANLTYLSDGIGSRLTGSPSLKKANEWAAEKMRSYGLTDVHLEGWTIPVSWERGYGFAARRRARSEPADDRRRHGLDAVHPGENHRRSPGPRCQDFEGNLPPIAAS